MLGQLSSLQKVSKSLSHLRKCLLARLRLGSLQWEISRRLHTCQEKHRPSLEISTLNFQKKPLAKGSGAGDARGATKNQTSEQKLNLTLGPRGQRDGDESWQVPTWQGLRGMEMVTWKSKWHFLSMGRPVSEAWTSPPSPWMHRLPGPLAGLSAGRPCHPNAGHVFGDTALTSKTTMDLAQKIRFSWSTKQCTFYPWESLGMTPAFRISSSPGSASDKLGELEID